MGNGTRKINKIVFIMVIALVTALLLSCTYGSYVTIKAFRNVSADSVYMRYEKFSGYLYRKVRLSAGETLSLDVKINTDSGSLDINLLDEEEHNLVAYATQNTLNEHFEYTAESKGVYRIRVKGDHSGSFEIKWSIT